jgi:hypothetical protein
MEIGHSDDATFSYAAAVPGANIAASLEALWVHKH